MASTTDTRRAGGGNPNRHMGSSWERTRPLEAIQRLHTLLSQPRTWSLVELAEDLGRSKRMVQRYLQYLRETMQAPIPLALRDGRYTYTDAGSYCPPWP